MRSAYPRDPHALPSTLIMHLSCPHASPRVCRPSLFNLIGRYSPKARSEGLRAGAERRDLSHLVPRASGAGSVSSGPILRVAWTLPAFVRGSGLAMCCSIPAVSVHALRPEALFLARIRAYVCSWPRFLCLPMRTLSGQHSRSCFVACCGWGEERERRDCTVYFLLL
jgi:hypothetical protein